MPWPWGRWTWESCRTSAAAATSGRTMQASSRRHRPVSTRRDRFRAMIHPSGRPGAALRRDDATGAPDGTRRDRLIGIPARAMLPAPSARPGRIPVTTPPDSYVTLAAAAGAEERIQRSRFVARAAPAPARAAAEAVVAAMRREFHDARHVCFAWRVGGPVDPQEVRQDDGEPSGTAGEPILQAIHREAIEDAVVVVTRYFGGVKLGTGGLGRAYGGVAAAAVAAAPRRTVELGRILHLEFDYGQQKTVLHLLEAHGGRLEDADYAARVTAALWLPHSTWRIFADQLHDTTAGRLRAAPIDE
ncbi:DUF1949 domain-containing protein [bacterium]|nr:DUF1949 domain-containing protein [bacterium]